MTVPDIDKLFEEFRGAFKGYEKTRQEFGKFLGDVFEQRPDDRAIDAAFALFMFYGANIDKVMRDLMKKHLWEPGGEEPPAIQQLCFTAALYCCIRSLPGAELDEHLEPIRKALEAAKKGEA